MKINLRQLKENLPKQQSGYLKTYTQGLFRVIDYAHNNASSETVDWSSFTLKDAKLALEMATEYLYMEAIDDIEEYDSPPNEGNAIHEYLHSTMIIRELRNASPEKNADVSMFF